MFNGICATNLILLILGCVWFWKFRILQLIAILKEAKGKNVPLQMGDSEGWWLVGEKIGMMCMYVFILYVHYIIRYAYIYIIYNIHIYIDIYSIYAKKSIYKSIIYYIYIQCTLVHPCQMLHPTHTHCSGDGNHQAILSAWATCKAILSWHVTWPASYSMKYTDCRFHVVIEKYVIHNDFPIRNGSQFCDQPDPRRTAPGSCIWEAPLC